MNYRIACLSLLWSVSAQGQNPDHAHTSSWDEQGSDVVVQEATAQVCQNKAYWADAAAGIIGRSNTNGTQVEVLISELDSPRGIAIDVDAGLMYVTMSSLGANDSGKVVRARLDGSALRRLVEGLHVPRGIALDLEDKRMYWSDFGGGTARLQRSRLDGSHVETIVVGAEAYELALDVWDRKVYWTHVTNDTGGVGHRQIRRANLDGSSVEIILDDLGTPDGIALDLHNGNIYWTDQSYHTVSRANLDGSKVELLVETEPVSRPFGIDLNLAQGKMYWVDWEIDVVRRANLDGSLLETLIDTGLDQPLGIALFLPPVNCGDTLSGDLLVSWGDCPTRGDCPADLDGDGSVGMIDLLILLGNWE